MITMKFPYSAENQVMKLSDHVALIVVDVQKGFTPGGHLAVAGSDEIIPTINQLAACFDNIILTQDWHPANHISFASNYPDKQPYDNVELAYGLQVLWPAHCVQGTEDAELHPALEVPTARLIIRKGFHCHIDSYSAFMEADHHTSTGLAGYLTAREIDTVYIVGIATDFCVAWTALDARKLGFQTYVIEDACKGIDLNDSLAEAWQQMQQQGVHRIHSSQLFSSLL